MLCSILCLYMTWIFNKTFMFDLMKILNLNQNNSFSFKMLLLKLKFTLIELALYVKLFLMQPGKMFGNVGIRENALACKQWHFINIYIVSLNINFSIFSTCLTARTSLFSLAAALMHPTTWSCVRLEISLQFICTTWNTHWII